MGIKDFYNKHKKKIIIAAIAIPTITGTFGGNEGGFAPFYNVKTGNSYGINIGIVNTFEEGSNHKGINIGFVNNYEDGGTCNGISIGGFNTYYGGTCNGIEVGVINVVNQNEENGNITGGNMNGLEIGLLNIGSSSEEEQDIKINGLQVGLGNTAAGNVVQIGVYNSIEKPNKETKRSCLVNWYFNKK